MQKAIIMNAEGWPGINLAAEMINSNANPLDIIEASIKATEANPNVRTVGFGGAPNALGEMELDASIINGDTLQCGAVGAIKNIMHPISVARKVMEKLPHVMLVGDGAEQFAKECGFPSEDILSPEAKADYDNWKVKQEPGLLVDLFSPLIGQGSHGTVICLTRNSQGSIAGGVSTSGWDYKYPGRLGDSPIIGAGVYADSAYGAAACTHCGENAIRTSLARSIVLYLKIGMDLTKAIQEGFKDLARLKGGYQGQVVIYAMDAEGNVLAARRYKEEADCFNWIYTEEMSEPKRLEAEFLG